MSETKKSNGKAEAALAAKAGEDGSVEVVGTVGAMTAEEATKVVLAILAMADATDECGAPDAAMGLKEAAILIAAMQRCRYDVGKATDMAIAVIGEAEAAQAASAEGRKA